MIFGLLNFILNAQQLKERRQRMGNAPPLPEHHKFEEFTIKWVDTEYEEQKNDVKRY